MTPPARRSLHSGSLSFIVSFRPKDAAIGKAGGRIAVRPTRRRLGLSSGDRGCGTMDSFMGQPQRYGRSSAEIASQDQFATVQLDQRPGDRQPKSSSFVLFGQVICDLLEGV